MDTQELITIGVIVAPHGVRGDVRILPRTDFPERFMKMDNATSMVNYTILHLQNFINSLSWLLLKSYLIAQLWSV